MQYPHNSLLSVSALTNSTSKGTFRSLKATTSSCSTQGHRMEGFEGFWSSSFAIKGRSQASFEFPLVELMLVPEVSGVSHQPGPPLDSNMTHVVTSPLHSSCASGKEWHSHLLLCWHLPQTKIPEGKSRGMPEAHDRALSLLFHPAHTGRKPGQQTLTRSQSLLHDTCHSSTSPAPVGPGSKSHNGITALGIGISGSLAPETPVQHRIPRGRAGQHGITSSSDKAG